MKTNDFLDLCKILMSSWRVYLKLMTLKSKGGLKTRGIQEEKNENLLALKDEIEKV